MHSLDDRDRDTYLKTIRQFKKILKTTYKISLLRFIFMAIVFTRSVTFITIQNKHYEVWCLLAYLMSGTIELINSLAHSGSLRILTKDEKTIKSNRNQELKIGKADIYSNLFSVTQRFKYEHKENILAYRMTRFMHIMCSLLIFGQMAMRKQHQLNTGLLKQIFLWMFMLTAYINSFQVDYTIFECSKGQKMKIERYSISKICEIYDEFSKWRTRYNSLLKTAIGLIILMVLWSITYGLSPQLTEPYSYELVFLISFLFVFTIIAIFLNQQLMKEAANSIKQYSEKDSYQFARHPNLTLYGILANHTPCKPQIWTLYRMSLIVLLFYWFWLPSSSYLLNLVFSVLLFAQYDKIKRGKDFKASYLHSLSYKDAIKYLRVKNCKSIQTETNVLLEQNLNIQQNKQKTQFQKTQQSNTSTGLVHLIQKQSRKGLQTCSVCLADYLPTSQILILPCGHIYHQQCLADWLKLKKQCPLCRNSLQDYYQVN